MRQSQRLPGLIHRLFHSEPEGIRHSGDFAGSTDGDGTGFEGTVGFGGSICDGIFVGGTYQSFDYHLIRYYIDEITAFCDNGMNPDMVIIPEGFALVSQGGKSEGGCI